MYNGIININKEKGFTSHDVVAKLRGILKQKKIGHTGTLDPDATGVLPVCLGNGTRLCDLLTDKVKEYEAVMVLGITTDTEDMSGNILSQNEVKLSEEEVREAVMSFVGEYGQIPPMYSAIKVNGKKLYELAREGKVIERQARTVVINRIQIISIDLPQVTFKVNCGKGTYIRSLCRDIGNKLGCGACMESLVRTQSGIFTLEKSYLLSDVEKIVKSGEIDKIIYPVDSVFAEYPEIMVKDREAFLVSNGNKFPVADRNITGKVRVYRYTDSAKVFAGIYESDEQGFFIPVKMFQNGE